MTLLGLLLRPVGDWPVRAPVMLLAVLGLGVRGARLRPALWLALTLLAGLRVALDWELADNHAYLLGYWCLAILLALAGSDAQGDLAASSRLLIGCVFLVAAIWKGLLSGDFLDGRAFSVSLILDPRFEPLTRWLGGVDSSALDALRAFLRTHADVGAGVPALVEIPRRLALVACALSFWTLGIESAIALAFLWPRSRVRVVRLRDPLLLCFCATTYPAIGIEGFGWLLLAMGIAQCEPERPRTRLAYLSVFGLLVLSREIPWRELMLASG